MILKPATATATATVTATATATATEPVRITPPEAECKGRLAAGSRVSGQDEHLLTSGTLPSHPVGQSRLPLGTAAPSALPEQPPEQRMRELEDAVIEIAGEIQRRAAASGLDDDAIIRQVVRRSAGWGPLQFRLPAFLQANSGHAAIELANAAMLEAFFPRFQELPPLARMYVASWLPARGVSALAATSWANVEAIGRHPITRGFFEAQTVRRQLVDATERYDLARSAVEEAQEADENQHHDTPNRLAIVSGILALMMMVMAFSAVPSEDRDQGLYLGNPGLSIGMASGFGAMALGVGLYAVRAGVARRASSQLEARVAEQVDAGNALAALDTGHMAEQERRFRAVEESPATKQS